MEPEQVSGNTADREQTRHYLNRINEWCSYVKNILGAAWLIGLTLGGLIFLTYYLSIGFIPEFDLQASIAFLIVVAITGIFIAMATMMFLLGPAYGWIAGLSILISTSNDEKLYELTQRWHESNLMLTIMIWFVLAIVPPIILMSYLPSGWTWVLLVSSAVWLFIISMLFCISQANVRIKDIVKNRRLILRFWKLLCFVFLLSLVPYHMTDNVGLVILLFSVNLTTAMLVLAKYSHPSLFESRPLLKLLIMYPIFMTGTVFFMPTSPYSIPNLTMEYYKLGSFYSTKFVLDKTGCEILNHYNIKPNNNAGNQCYLSHVKIFSRLGSTYYVQAKSKDNPQTLVSFTMPAVHILSWGTTPALPNQESIGQSSPSDKTN